MRPSQLLSEPLSNVIATKHFDTAGYFRWRHPTTRRYTYANWGSRPYEYRWAAERLAQIGIHGRTVVDLGIGLPSDSDWYRFYAESGCELTGIDPDGRLEPVTHLAPGCLILRRSAEELPFPSSSVDVAVALSSLEHFPADSFGRALAEIHRVLKHGGLLLVTLDLTVEKPRSAPWAILEKTLCGLPAGENEVPLPAGEGGLTLERFLELGGRRFDSPRLPLVDVPLRKRVHNLEWNAMTAYAELRKA